ncbi:MAG: sugar transferase [Clostridia bacterium]|nr:sugar transferase [Clostridia bacterium]
MLRKWEDLPDYMRVSEVKPYYEALKKKQFSLFCKRVFDIFAALIILVTLAPVMLVIAVLIKLDSKGAVFYRQERVTTYGKHFRIHKFRTMVSNADQIGAAVTVVQDSRITRTGRWMRKLRLDELPQLFDVLQGAMSFVGTRPEAVKYVEQYNPEYYATLLLPAGITSEASIRYKDEDELLGAADDVDKVYIEQVLPGKMKWNLDSIKRFGFWRDIATMFRTVAAVLWKDYKDETEQTENHPEETVKS